MGEKKFKYNYRASHLKNVRHVGRNPAEILNQLAFSKYSKIIKWSMIIIIVALAGLVVHRLTSKGLSELSLVSASDILNIAIQLFAIINPLSALPTFLLYTQGVNFSTRNKIVNTTTMIVIALIFSFALFGQLILNALQITVTSFMLGGGVLLMIIAIDMLGGTVRSKSMDMDQVAIVPLATPLLVGPGTMTTLIVLTSTQNLLNILIGGIIAASAVFLILRYAHNISIIIGKNGMLACSRLMAIILAAIAANMIHGALFAWGIAKI